MHQKRGLWLGVVCLLLAAMASAVAGRSCRGRRRKARTRPPLPRSACRAADRRNHYRLRGLHRPYRGHDDRRNPCPRQRLSCRGPEGRRPEQGRDRSQERRIAVRDRSAELRGRQEQGRGRAGAGPGPLRSLVQGSQARRGTAADARHRPGRLRPDRRRPQGGGGRGENGPGRAAAGGVEPPVDQSPRAVRRPGEQAVDRSGQHGPGRRDAADDDRHAGPDLRLFRRRRADAAASCGEW